MSCKRYMYSFENTIDTTLNEFGHKINAIFKFIYEIQGKSKPNDLDKDYSEFVKACKVVDKFSYKLYKAPFVLYIRDFLDNEITFLEYLEQALSPNKNGFSLVKPGAYIRKQRNLDRW